LGMGNIGPDHAQVDQGDHSGADDEPGATPVTVAAARKRGEGRTGPERTNETHYRADDLSVLRFNQAAPARAGARAPMREPPSSDSHRTDARDLCSMARSSEARDGDTVQQPLNLDPAFDLLSRVGHGGESPPEALRCEASRPEESTHTEA